MRLGRIQNNTSLEGFETVRDQKLDFLEFCCNNDKETLDLIHKEEEVFRGMDKTGLPISSVGRWNHELLRDGQIQQDKLEIYKELMTSAIHFGAKTFVLGCNYDASVSLYQNYTLAIKAIRELVDFADGRIHVAIENCDWNNFLVSPEQWKIVLGEIPELGLKYDASHAYNRGDDYLAEVADWADRFYHVHIKGVCHAGGKKPVDDPPAGMDDLRWPSIFAVLYSRGYRGDLSIEPHSAAWLGELGNFGIIYTRDYIRKLMA